MNVYVISDCEYREGATVIGAAVDRERAEKIADRPSDDSRVVGWSPWKEDVSPSDGSCAWTRDALLADGKIHLSLYQEIVVVPLDGVD